MNPQPSRTASSLGRVAPTENPQPSRTTRSLGRAGAAANKLNLELHENGNSLSTYSLDRMGKLKAKFHGARVNREGESIVVSRGLLQAYPTHNGHGTALANAFDLALVLLHEDTGSKVVHKIETRIQKPHVVKNYASRGYEYEKKLTEFLQGKLEIDSNNAAEVKARALNNGGDTEAAEQIKNALKHCLQRVNE